MVGFAVVNSTVVRACGLQAKARVCICTAYDVFAALAARSFVQYYARVPSWRE